jgi:hypothetical protein
VAHDVAGPQRADDHYRLLEHLQADVGLGPRVAEDVLVERLAAAHAEPEPAFAEQHRAGGRRLGDHRRVNPECRTGDGRGHRQVAYLRQRPDHRPDERRLTLLTRPRVVVVADPQCVEAGLLGQPSLLDELVRRILLGGQEVPDCRHASGIPRPPRVNHR